MIKAIIFDWSGVISDDWNVTYLATMDALKSRGIPTMPESKFKRLYDQPWNKFYENIGVKVDVKEEYELWEKLMLNYRGKMKPFPYARKALEWLKEKNIKAIVLSARETGSLHKEIEDNGLKELIAAVYSGHNNKKDKIGSLIHDHSIEKKSTLYVGDSTHDIDTARHAGIRSVAVLSGYDSKEKLEKEGPDYVLESVAELPALIEKINGE